MSSEGKGLLSECGGSSHELGWARGPRGERGCAPGLGELTVWLFFHELTPSRRVPEAVLGAEDREVQPAVPTSALSLPTPLPLSPPSAFQVLGQVAETHTERRVGVSALSPVGRPAKTSNCSRCFRDL